MLLIFIAISIAIISTLLTQGKPLNELITTFSKGAGQKNMLLMVWIFVLAGAFASSAKATGAVEATVNLTLQLLPANFLLPGLFLAACLVSLCMGTSVGTIVALMPITAGLAERLDMSVALMAASIVSGAFFGDNLSFISDTTIVATQSQGCKPHEKFKYNFFLVLPVAIIVCIIYALMGNGSSIVEVENGLWWKIIPYMIVLLSAACGMNVMFVLLIGNIATGIMALIDSSCSFVDWINSLSSGIMGMSELILISMIAGGIFALIAEQGIMERFINLISSKIHSKRGAELSIVLLVGLVNMMTANNTVAILSVGDIAKRIANRYNIVARRMASILDITSCAVQGLLPYGAQLLMASSLAGITALSIMPYLYYPMLIGLMVILTILIPNTLKGKKKAI
jgi:Na+/H+ antiporter NhaC